MAGTCCSGTQCSSSSWLIFSSFIISSVVKLQLLTQRGRMGLNFELRIQNESLLRVRDDPETEANLFLLSRRQGGYFYLDNKLSVAKEASASLLLYFLFPTWGTKDYSNIFWIGLKFSICLCSSMMCRQSCGCCLWLQASLKSFSSCSDPQRSCCFIDDCTLLLWWSNAGISLVRTTSTKMYLFASWSNKSDIKNSIIQEFCSR